MPAFEIVSDFTPTGDQPRAIEELSRGLSEGRRDQVLLGVTGSGKTFTVAQVIERCAAPDARPRPQQDARGAALQEFKRLFPKNAVEYFVSYYDYYQPEAYVPQSDTYIEKESTINDEIDRMRHSATRALFERRDVLIVASVSCIYGLGSPEAYHGMMLLLERGMTLDRDFVLRKLVAIQYRRVNTDLERGAFRVRGDVLEIWPSYAEDALRVEFWGDEIESIARIDPRRGKVVETLPRHPVYPNSHYVHPARDDAPRDGDDPGGAGAPQPRSSSGRGSSSRRSASTSARASTSR
jgi:excinuclease ABC subunit B